MKKWVLLIVLIAVLAITYRLDSGLKKSMERVELDVAPVKIKHAVNKATLTPGRVVELQLKKGKIDFVMFEKDCPVTTKRIAELVAAKQYDGVAFPRIEKWVVQTTDVKQKLHAIDVELTDRIKNIVGAVGMARKDNYDSNVSIFYILKTAAPHLDREYTVFGQVIRGMNVVNALAANDTIQSAKLRALTPEDELLLKKALLQPAAKK